MSGMTKEEYLELLNPTKEIEVKEGVIFKIRKVSMKDMLLKGMFPIKNASTIKIQDEEQPKKELSEEETLKVLEKNTEIGNYLIVKGTVEPKISLKHCDDMLCVEDLLDDVATLLFTEISKYSFNEEGGADLKPFRNGEASPNTGHDGASVQDVAEPDIKDSAI